jgi:5-hydroxyisourate hydrolase
MAASLSPITTHILDTARGLPAADIPVRLERYAAGLWRQLAQGKTNTDGRLLDWWPGEQLEAGDYRLCFHVADYLVAHHGPAPLYPQIQVDFRVAAGQTHYHLPLLLSPYGYTTYRGS